MSSRKDKICTYFDGFRASDHAKILALLTEEVVWDIYGHRRLEGKEAFGGEIENAGLVGSRELIVDRLIEEGDTIAVPYLGKVERNDGGRFSFAATDVFTFDGDLISHVESYVVLIQT
jgi:uncharacterized protein